MYYICALLNRSSANDVHSQAYLLEGLARWNKDCAASVGGGVATTYDSPLVSAINKVSQQVVGKAISGKGN